jgi:cytochrome c553
MNGSLANITKYAQDNWGSLKTHLILDQYRTANNAGGAANVPSGFSLPAGYVGMWVTAKKYDVSEVDVVIGQTRKQRYGVYYDGGAVDEVYLVYSTNGGIKYELYPDETNPAVPKLFTGTFAGEKNRAGYKLLWVEVQLDRAAQANANNYEEWRSWQERCVDCHTTGFNRTAYNQAFADFKAGTRADMKDFFFTEWQVSCEACHSPGANHSVINPAKLPKTPGV